MATLAVDENTRQVRPASIRSGSSKQWTPEQYVSSILAYAKQRSSTLHTGVHFTKLVHILHKPFASSAKHNGNLSDDFITLNKCTSKGAIEYCEPQTPEKLRQHADTEANNILFLRGQPCPAWVANAGASYHVDPEFFYRHLELFLSMSRKQYFAQPSLVSTSRNIIQLKYMTIGEFPGWMSNIGQSGIEVLRISADKDMVEYFNYLGKQIAKSSSSSESIVRSYHILDEHHFAIEQQATICLSQTAKGWTVVVWLDTGKPLTLDQVSPWMKILQKNRASGQETFLPWIQVHPFASLHATSLSVAHDRRAANDSEQSASLIHLDYGKMLDKNILTQDPFYALHELFVLCAYSEVQFLNIVESKIRDDAAEDIVPDHNISPANTIYFQSLLEGHINQLRQTIVAIQSRDNAGWPRPSDTDLKQKSTASAQTLLQDYEGLLRRAETLCKLCKSRLQILMSKAGIVESNKAIEQAKVVTKLTRSAFVFIPLSFVSSFFGMNLGPLVDKPAYGLWVFFAVSAPLVLLLFASITCNFSQMWYIFQRHGRDRQDLLKLEDTE